MNHTPALPRPGHNHRLALGLEGPRPLPPRGHPHRPRAEDCVRGAQEGRLHHAECGRGQPLREGVRIQLGRGVLHDGLDPHLLGRIHALVAHEVVNQIFCKNPILSL